MATFGFSVGDFIAGINLLIKTISAVKDRGSSAEYRAVTATLRQLSSVFEGIIELPIEDPAQRRALEVLTTKCGQTILEFLTKIKKYDASLGTPKTSRQWEAAIRRVQWSLCSQEELRKFQAQLQADLLALQTTLQMINIKLLTAHSQHTTEALARIERRNEQAKALQILIVQSLSHCFLEFRGLLLMLFAANMRIMNMLLGGLQMQAQVQDERPVYLDDPHERLIPLLRSWIHDWDDFETLLKIQFKRVPGLRKISAGEYVLHDELRSKDISRYASVDTVFLPGRRITMSILFDIRKISKACPRCFAPIQGNNTREQKCVSCKVRFSSYRIRRPEDDIVFNSSMPAWSFHPPPLLDRERKPAAEERHQTASDSDSPDPEALLPESMENFTRIRIAERVGKWPRAKGAAKFKDAVDVPNEPKVFKVSKVPRVPKVPYVPYVPKQTDPILQWFRDLSGEPIFDDEGLYQLLEMDDDDNHEFTRDLINNWKEEFILRLEEMKKSWHSREYSHVCKLGDYLLETCWIINIQGPRDSLRELHRCYSGNGNYDENTLVRIKDLMKKVNREFRNCCDDIVQGWNVQNWGNSRIVAKESSQG